MRNQTEDFAELQKLLAVKRHEAPPPRFFNQFSQVVLDRITEVADPEPMTWWQRMGLDFDLKPAFVCAWGVALCVALLVGIIGSVHNVPSTPVTAHQVRESVAGFPFAGVVLSDVSPMFSQVRGSTDPVLTFNQFGAGSRLAGYGFEKGN